MKHNENTVFMNMCMVYDGDKVVVQNRLSDDWPGVSFPGGHVEPGESFADAVIREVYEETGLTIQCPQLCGVKDWTENECRYVVLLYKTNQFTGTLRSSREGEVFWLSLDELKAADLAEGMEETIKVFLDDNLSEMFYIKEQDAWTITLK